MGAERDRNQDHLVRDANKDKDCYSVGREEIVRYLRVLRLKIYGFIPIRTTQR